MLVGRRWRMDGWMGHGAVATTATLVLREIDSLA